MEVWGMDYAAIVSMPSSVRYRMLLKKIDLEKKRAEAREKR